MKNRVRYLINICKEYIIRLGRMWNVWKNNFNIKNIFKWFFSGDWVIVLAKMIFLYYIIVLLWDIIDLLYSILEYYYNNYSVRCSDDKNNDKVNNFNLNIKVDRIEEGFGKMVWYGGIVSAANKFKKPSAQLGVLAGSLLLERTATYFVNKNKNKTNDSSNSVPGGSSNSVPGDSSNFISGDPFENMLNNIEKYIKDLFPPVDHSIPVDVLIHNYSYIILYLFIISIITIMLMINFFIDLIVIYNKDWIFTKIKNKYLLMYAKYSIFRSKIEIFALGIIILIYISFIAYSLHYLMVHPIII